MAIRYTRLLAMALAGSAALLLAWGIDARAQSDFPNRPVRMVNPYTPGGSVDLVGRAVAAGLSEIWGQQVIVDNRPGAGTQIGTEIVVRAEPDGYTMLCNSSAIAIMPSIYRNMRFDSIRDLSPIVEVATSSSLLAIHPGVPARSVKVYRDSNPPPGSPYTGPGRCPRASRNAGTRQSTDT